MTKPPIPVRTRRQVARDAHGQCGYCRSTEAIQGLPLEFDHLKSISNGGKSVRSNLWLACSLCNKRKGDRDRVPDPETKAMVRLFNPRQDDWNDHFCWADGGLCIEGKTDVGRATVLALKLNLRIRITARRAWIAAGWHPPRS